MLQKKRKEPGSKPRKSLIGPAPTKPEPIVFGHDFDLPGYQSKLTTRIFAAVMTTSDHLTLNRRKPSLDEIRAAGDEIVFAALAREQGIFGEAIGGNLVRGAVQHVDGICRDAGVVPTCITASMWGRTRYCESLIEWTDSKRWGF